MSPHEPQAIGLSMAIERARGSRPRAPKPETNGSSAATERARESRALQRLREPQARFPRELQANGSSIGTSLREGAMTMQPSPGRTARLSGLRFAREP